MAGAQVVQTLMVELDGRTIQLEAKIAQMEKRLQQFEGKATQGAQTTGRVVGSIGDRYAMAARQIAMAGETAARTGQLAGAAGRQILSQGANMALMFGAHGAIAGGVAITTMAIVEMFVRARKEMEETTNKFRGELEQLARSGNLAGVAFERQRRFSGDPYAIRKAGESEEDWLARRHGLQGVSGRLDAINARDAGIRRGDEDDGLTGGLAQARRQNLLNTLRDEREILVKHKETLTRELAEIQPILDKAVDDAVFKTDQEIQRGAEKAGLKGDSQLAKDREQMVLHARAELAKLTTTLRDDLELQLEQLETLAREKFGTKIPAEITRQLTAMREKIADVEVMEPLLQQLEGLESKVQAALQRKGPMASIELGTAFRELDRVAAAIERQMEGVDKTTERYKEQEKALKRIRDLQVKIADASADAAKPPKKPDDDTVRKAIELGRQIENVTRGTIQLAEAFGLVDANSARVLENMAQIAANLPAAFAGDPGAIVSVLGGVAALFSGDEGAGQRRRVLEENTKALRELTRKAGLLGSALGLSGTDLAAADTLLGQIDAQRTKQLQGTRPGAIELMGLWKNLSAEQRAILEAVAKSFGITLDGTEAAFIALQKAIDFARAKLAEFGNDFEGVNAWLEFERQIFGDQGPLANLSKLLEQLGGVTTRTIRNGREVTVPNSTAYSPGIAAILRAGDPNTAEGRAAMRRIIEQYAELMRAGGGSISAELLGGLGGDEFRQAILQIVEYLNQLDQGGADGTDGYSISRQITEVTGDRIAALLTNIWTANRQAVDYLQQLVAGLVGPIAPPALPALVSGSGGGVHFEAGAIVVNLGLPPGATAADVATYTRVATTEALSAARDYFVRELSSPASPSMDAIDRSLQSRVSRRQRGRGDRGLPG